jgi:hypothetical protein
MKEDTGMIVREILGVGHFTSVRIAKGGIKETIKTDGVWCISGSD